MLPGTAGEKNTTKKNRAAKEEAGHNRRSTPPLIHPRSQSRITHRFGPKSLRLILNREIASKEN